MTGVQTCALPICFPVTICSFDTDTGVFKPEASPVLVAAGRNVLPSAVSDPA